MEDLCSKIKNTIEQDDTVCYEKSRKTVKHGKREESRENFFDSSLQTFYPKTSVCFFFSPLYIISGKEVDR